MIPAVHTVYIAKEFSMCIQGRPKQMRGPMQDLAAGPNAGPRRGAPLSSDF